LQTENLLRIGSLGITTSKGTEGIKIAEKILCLTKEVTEGQLNREPNLWSLEGKAVAVSNRCQEEGKCAKGRARLAVEARS
jgi:hypothetical protein